MGHTFAAANNLPRAAEHLARAVQLAPQNADAHAMLADVLTKQGKPEAARVHAAEAERLKRSQTAP